MDIRAKGLACAFGVWVATMGSISNASGLEATPAELPPAGYDERFFVDSTGCMFIRAGTATAVTWVPRVNRDRSQVCGFRPTGGVAAAVAASAPAVAKKPVPVTRTLIPAGYKAAWTDGRLNAMRGPRTAAGDASMALTWTDEVPMRRK